MQLIDASRPDVTRLLRALHRLFGLRRVLGRAVEGSLPHGSVALLAVIAGLGDSGEIRLSDLAARLQLHQSVVSRQTGELVVRGLVQRRADPADGRSVLLCLTAAGSSVLESAMDAFGAAVAGPLENWDAADVVALTQGVDRFACAVETAYAGPRQCRTGATRSRPARADADDGGLDPPRVAPDAAAEPLQAVG